MAGGGFETVTATDAVLFGTTLGSGVMELTAAELMICVPFTVAQGTPTTSANCAVAPLSIDGALQLIWPPLPTVGVVQVQLAGAINDWKTVPGGRASNSATLLAASWPLLVTVVV